MSQTPLILHRFQSCIGLTANIYCSPSFTSSTAKATIMDFQKARDLQNALRIFYPIFILLLYTIGFSTRAMIIARKYDRNTFPPHNGRHLVRDTSVPSIFTTCFRWLSFSILVSYIFDGMIYIAHVVKSWPEHWWGGESIIVRLKRVAQTVGDRSNRYRYNLLDPSSYTWSVR